MGARRPHLQLLANPVYPGAAWHVPNPPLAQHAYRRGVLGGQHRTAEQQIT